MRQRIGFWFRSFVKIKTTDDCKRMNLQHSMNLHGDVANRLKCRSIWYDKYGNTYRCEQSLESEGNTRELPRIFQSIH